MHRRRNILSTLLLVFWEPKDRADEKNSSALFIRDAFFDWHIVFTTIET